MNGTAAVAHLPPDVTIHGGTDSSIASTSSIPSSFQLDEGGILNGMNDLEEIGLDDDNEAERGRSNHRMAQRGSLSNTLRDLTHVQLKRPPYPTVQTNLPAHSQPVDHLAAPASSGRSKKSHSIPAVQRPISRNSSPALSTMVPTGYSNGVGGSTASNGYRPKTSPCGPRRTSWQRKTSEQLEEEYDSDDEVPPDAIFYNVPLSPRSSKAYSSTPSPERETNGDKSDETGTTTLPNSRSLPTSTINRNPSRLGPRSKSWSDAMFELGAEAKELSEALERHADKELVRTEKRLQQKSESLPAKKKSPTPSTHTVELPPLQVSNGLIDPLPISKEKEAVLSRTRPSWLPPKSKEEEKRHLKEYQRMMRRSQEAGASKLKFTYHIDII